MSSNFFNSRNYAWHDDGSSIVCADGNEVLFAFFTDSRRNELINAYQAGLRRGMEIGRDQKTEEILRVL